MMNHVMPSIVQMEAEVLENLLKEVKETVATHIVTPETAQPEFRAVNMWNILRNAKTARSRMGW